MFEVLSDYRKVPMYVEKLGVKYGLSTCNYWKRRIYKLEYSGNQIFLLHRFVYVLDHVCAGAHLCVGAQGGQRTTSGVILQAP